MRSVSHVRPDDPVRKIMMWPVAAVDGGAKMLEAAEELAADDVGALVVLEHGDLAGVVSERDIVHHLALGADPEHLEVRDIMSVELVTVTPRDTVMETARRLLAAGVRHLPVVDGELIAGVVSIRDVLEVLVKTIDSGRAVLIGSSPLVLGGERYAD